MANPAKPLAVVTGASSGIGFELAKQFAGHGYDLVIAAEDDELIPAARALQDQGAGVDAVRVDLSAYEGVEELVDRVAATGRPVDSLAVNAGVGVGGAVLDSALRDQLRVVNLNITSAVHLTHRLTKPMAERKAGRVLFTSSIAATAPGPYHAVYAASKAFLQSFSEGLRTELKDSGVTVTALLPGPTDTEFFDRAGMRDTKIGSGPKDDPADVAREGFEALMQGDDKVVAGSAKNKVQTAASRVLPDKAKAAQMAKMAEPGGGKRDEEEREEVRGEQGTSSGDPHDDTDPQSG
ncbi:SDR family NAD(P)-dependent oxidoreductase [Amycolatopsis decaplanina]|uniref:Dehydrogenase DhgA n=1 Tax=Amycolatopsis decaplanina DSM 44594 TaxID=1284240 RepID=M2ZIV4_9PSEU|nr:SDR family NAD(P)-dependent oxidoreductase [Amycolatopsis decaplanina]EME60853.1 dehydrogenase DhgA [Amycolatopsis decaplanina DSM 44594]